jgi:hypothetical protein
MEVAVSLVPSAVEPPQAAELVAAELSQLTMHSGQIRQT